MSVQDRFIDGEERWQTLGIVGGGVLLLAAHTTHDESTHDLVIRIISARHADRRERRMYESETR